MANMEEPMKRRHKTHRIDPECGLELRQREDGKWLVGPCAHEECYYQYEQQVTTIGEPRWTNSEDNDDADGGAAG